jgi:hypothetical protein
MGMAIPPIKIISEGLMVTYPVHLRRDSYKGSNERKKEKALAYNAAVSKIEDHVNDLLKNQTAPIRSYFYFDISIASGFSLELVEKVCYSIDCGSYGFTAYKSGMTLTQALDSASLDSSKT